jgi:nicotinate-nucleotide adenylyltransferase
MRLGLYGGTFDPVHQGHIHAALSSYQYLSLSEVRMILAARPDHRDQPDTPNVHRWEMLKLACADHPELEADATEVKRPGKSYAIDTLSSFRRRYPQAQLCWILGMDSYATLPSWHCWRDLLTFGHLAVLERPGHTVSVEPALEEFERAHRAQSLGEGLAGRIVFVPTSMLTVSASQIRCQRKAGAAPEHLLDHKVWSYINQHQLYVGQEE